jgi:hypothetical protein
MRFRLFFVALLIISVLVPLSAQQPSLTSLQAAQLLQGALAALIGNQSLSDIRLTGAARRIAGSDEESGTVTLKALASGESRVDLNLPSSTGTELCAKSTYGDLVGYEIGPDGAHRIPEHNMRTGCIWFFPAFAISRFITGSATYGGEEIRDGKLLKHLSASQLFPWLDPEGAAFAQRLSQTEIFLDPVNRLPIAFEFNTHSESNALLDIPIEVRYSDYRIVSGVQVPFRIQKYRNNSLILDLQLENATTNSGLAPTAFAPPSL